MNKFITNLYANARSKIGACYDYYTNELQNLRDELGLGRIYALTGGILKDRGSKLIKSDERETFAYCKL
jgi:hypothetical protein